MSEIENDPIAMQIFDALRAKGIDTGHAKNLAASRVGITESITLGSAGVDITLNAEGKYALSTTWVGRSTGERGRAIVDDAAAAAELTASYLADPGKLGRIGKKDKAIMASLASYTKGARVDFSQDTMDQLKEWVLDCQWDNIEDASDLDEFSDTEIVNAVHANFDGGIPEFFRSGLDAEGNVRSRPALSGDGDLRYPEPETDVETPGQSQSL